MRARISRFTCETVVGKTIQKGGGGPMTLPATAKLEVLEVGSLEDLKGVISSLSTKQYLTYSLPKEGTTHDVTTISKVLTAVGLRPGEEAKAADAIEWGVHPIARSKHFLEYKKGPGVLVIDYDPNEVEAVKGRHEVAEILEKAVPGLTSKGYLWGPSSSSYILDEEEDKTYSDLKGQRFYFLVEDLENVPKFGEYLFNSLVCSGKYWIKQSSGVGGNLYVRTYVDKALFRECQPDFAARPHCIKPLTPMRDKMVLVEGEGGFLNLSQLLPDAEEVRRIGEAARRVSRRAKEEYRAGDAYLKRVEKAIEDEVDKARDKNPEMADHEEGRLRAQLRELSQGVKLAGSWVIVLEDLSEVTVDEILRNKKAWHGRRCFDPAHLDDADAKGIIYSDQPSPIIYSYRGTTYPLHSRLQKLDITYMNEAEVSRAITTHICQEGVVVREGGALKILTKDGILDLDRHSLAIYVGGVFDITKEQRKGVKRDSLNRSHLELILSSLLVDKRIQDVETYTTRPVIKRSGEVDLEQGVHAWEKILRTIPVEGKLWDPELPRELDDRLIHEAVKTLWAPIKEYKYADGRSEAMAFGSLLLAVVRPYIDVSPYILIKSDQPGAGKTYLASIIASLVEKPRRMNVMRRMDDGFMENELTTSLRTGKGVHIFDNFDGDIESPFLEMFATNKYNDSRTLHTQDSSSIRNNLLVLMTGNKTRTLKALSRRTYRIDILKDSNPSREWADPLSDIERDESVKYGLLQAVYTIYQSYFLANPGRLYDEETVSFREFDELVRNVLLWLMGRGYKELQDFEDPISQLEENKGLDPEEEEKYEILSRLWEVTKGRVFRASEFGDAVRSLATPRGDAGVEEALKVAVVEAIRGGDEGFSATAATHSVSRWLGREYGSAVRGLKLLRLSRTDPRTPWEYRIIDELGEGGGDCKAELRVVK